MRIRGKIMYPYLLLLIIAIINWFMQPNKKPATQINIPAQQTTASASATIVTKIVDGDTIHISTGQKVRYIGIDTPETKDPKKGQQCFGQEASQKNKELVDGKEIRMEKDVSETDRYGRLLRYVYVTDKTASPAATIFVNEYLVKEGYAYAVTFPPDVKYYNHFRELQNEAMRLKKGLWGKCQQDSPDGGTVEAGKL